MLLWVGLAGIAIGLFTLYIVWRKGGLRGQFHLTEPTGLLMLFGVGFLLGGTVTALIDLDRRQDRAELDAALVEMFGRPPDDLQLTGDTLDEFGGTARYGDATYKIEVRRDMRADREEFVGTQKRTIKEYVVRAYPLRPSEP